jgi:hypothetical protein
MWTMESLRDEKRGIHRGVGQYLNHVSHRHGIAVVVEIF